MNRTLTLYNLSEADVMKIVEFLKSDCAANKKVMGRVSIDLQLAEVTPDSDKPTKKRTTSNV